MPRGWCPGVFTPMEAPDGLLVRVKPRLSRLDAATARCIATEAAACGNGRIELTSRANLQLRGLTPASAERFARAMIRCGAADADPAAERRRNIIVSPLAGDDPTIRGRPELVAGALELALANARDLHLPAKFGFAVDGGGVLPLGDTGADIVVTTLPAHSIPPRNAEAADGSGCEADRPAWGPRIYIVQIAGATGGIACSETRVPRVAIDLARAFVQLGGRRRMRDLVETRGATLVYSTIGMIPDRPAFFSKAIISAPPPELTPGALIAAADRAEAAGDGFLRITPWRTLLIARNRALAA